MVTEISELQVVFILQACRAYEQFMIDLAKLMRKDRGLAINETRIREEVTQVIDLERDIANVSMDLCFAVLQVEIWIQILKNLLYFSKYAYYGFEKPWERDLVFSNAYCSSSLLSSKYSSSSKSDYDQ